MSALYLSKWSAKEDGGLTTTRKDVSFNVNITDVKNDLTPGKGRPQWILSAYGPGRNPPTSLFEDSEYSFEELRVRYYELGANGNQGQADQEASALWSKCEGAMADVAARVDNVAKFMEEAEKKHPNRFDFCKADGTKTRDQVAQEADTKNTSAASTGFGQRGFGEPSKPENPFSKPPSTFGQPAAPSGFGSGGFGKPAQPSAFGQPSAGFGRPALNNGSNSPFGAAKQSTFGQPSQPTPAFGQPTQPSSSFGQPSQPTPAFGQPSQPSSSFGQPSQPTSTFGQPSQPSGFGATGFGQPAQPNSTFGQPTQPASTFGQPSQPDTAFGQPSQPASTFGQPSQPTSAFGQSSQPSQPSGFGNASLPSQPATSSAFGQPPQPATSSPFGQPAQPSTGSTFGQPTAPANPFNQPPTSQASNAFDAKPAVTTAGFGQPSQPVARSNPVFGEPAPALANPFESPAPSVVPSVFKNQNSSTTPHPLTNRPPHPLHYTQTLPEANASNTKTDPRTRKLTQYRGRRVQYFNDVPCYERPDGQGWERVWFPDGPATADVVALGKEDKIGDLVAKPELYTEEVKEEYKYVLENGKFKDGKMPTVPPLREWYVYDF